MNGWRSAARARPGRQLLAHSPNIGKGGPLVRVTIIIEDEAQDVPDVEPRRIIIEDTDDDGFRTLIDPKEAQ